MSQYYQSPGETNFFDAVVQSRHVYVPETIT